MATIGHTSGSGVATNTAGDEPIVPKEKTPKELEKERKKAEKAAKFAQKKAKPADTASAPKTSKPFAKEEQKLPEYVEQTPPGEKKILRPYENDPYTKAYLPKVVESAWYDWWEKEGFFKPEFSTSGEVKPAGKFIISLPPPNVTGALHCGHALGNALQDLLIRWHRMRGFTTVWVPGCDHAGISTQSVVEKMLWNRHRQTRHDLGRSKFTDLVWSWKDEYHEKINRVQRRMGGSMDWSREAFTLNENFTAAVKETFCRLHEEGFIYRSGRLVNWCTALNTSLSNLEVENKELSGRTLLDVPGYERKVEFGVLTYFKYPVEGSNETIEIATTRPETMLGDTGIAVHPQDERFKHLVGKSAVHPFLPDRRLPIIADEYVDKDFGTGAVKLTPAHDQNDYNLGKKHNLEFINILTDDGLLNSNAGPMFEGKKRFDARYIIVEELQKRDLFVKKESHSMRVPLCLKSKDIIEPLVKPQWWMRMKELAEPAIAAVRSGEIKVRPEKAEKSYYHWMENIQDWCLSRQLWWGHQIPAYFISLEGQEGDQIDNNLWVTGQTEAEAEDKARKRFPNTKFVLKRDPDCLDTWFSSGLWPFGTLGWPAKTPDFEKLFPTSCLETGWDILFFWIARMIILSLKLTGKVPFTEVYCHSLIRDSEGRKMSKSLGNVIDPVNIMDGIDLESLHAKLLVGNLDPKEITQATKYQKTAFPQGIPECGADALRFTLVSYTTGGGDINFDIKVMHAYRRFCNKIYQASRYVVGKLISGFVPNASVTVTGKESLAERWILHRFNVAAAAMDETLKAREFSKSTQIAVQYIYDELCDVFIENSKAILADGSREQQLSTLNTLYTALEGGLKLIHPMMPFLTEELWQRLPRRSGDSTKSIMIASYPQFDPKLEDLAASREYDVILGCSKGVRSLMAQYSIKENGKAYVHCLDAETHNTVSSGLSSIKSLSGKGVNLIEVLAPGATAPVGCAIFIASSSITILLDIRGRIQVDQEIQSAKGKLEKAKRAVEEQKKVMNQWSDEDQRISEAAKAAELTKLQVAEAEVRNYERSIEQFEQLRLEEGK